MPLELELLIVAWDNCKKNWLLQEEDGFLEKESSVIDESIMSMMSHYDE